MEGEDLPTHGLSTTIKDVPTSVIDEERNPSIKAWETVIHTALVGNGIFPQAFLAQGILLANSMEEEANREKILLWKFLEKDPPGALINSMFSQARDKSHAAYGIKTNPSGVVIEPLHNVWNSDKTHAQSVLTNLAGIAYENKYDTPSPKLQTFELSKGHRELLQDMQNDPAFQGLLTSAAEGLTLETVRNQSRQYKQKIVAFMQNYASGSWSQYEFDRRQLRKDLVSLLSASTSTIKAHMLRRAAEQYPQQEILLSRLAKVQPIDLFGDPGVVLPHPLRNPDYE